MGRKKSQRGGSSGRGSSSLKQKKASGIEQFGQSEVDAFHSSKDEVALSGGGAASGESEDESSDSSDWVMDDVNKGEDSEDEDDEQDLDSDAEEDRELKAWGKKKSKYYGADTHELDIEYDSDDAKDEEEEAKRLSKVQAKTLNNADFGLDDDEEEEDEDEEDQDLETRSKASGKNTGAGKQQQKKKDKTKAKAAKSAKKSSDASVETIQRDVSKMSREEKLQVLLNESPEVSACSQRTNTTRAHESLSSTSALAAPFVWSLRLCLRLSATLLFPRACLGGSFAVVGAAVRIQDQVQRVA